MLDKLKVTLLFGVILQVMRVFFPDLDISTEFEGATLAVIEALYIIIPIAAGWFTKESEVLVAGLVLKKP